MEKAISVFGYSNDDRLSAADFSSAEFAIRMLSGGFCLAVLSKDGEILALHQYSFLPNLSVEEKITAIETARQPFHLKCEKTVFQLYTNVNTQIPEAFYAENLNPAIADLLVNKSKDYVPVGEKIGNEPLYNLSLWNTALMKKIKSTFPNYELKTVIGSLLEKVARREPQDEAIVFVEDMNFTIIARNAKGLLGCNCFAFDAEADFLYYCLYFLRKMYPHVDAVPLTLCGNITAQSPLFTAVKKYVARVELLENPAATIANYHYYCDII